ncbi:MAG: O-antigen ligase family protein [Candidatus Levybacteria bacterium]|nr:O-antigen ligase family protein [Candidatus Levybacteria bacterium]
MTKSSRSLKEKAGTGFWWSAQNLERLIFYLLILFLPTQLGKHFWSDFSIVSGIRVDYLSPTIYVTDIFILLLFVFSVSSIRISKIKYQISKMVFAYWRLIVLVIFLAIGIWFSKNTIAGGYGLLKFLEFLFLGFYVATNFKKFGLRNIVLLFSVGIILESLLAIAQYFQQASLGSIFYFFGERTFSLTTPGIANASLNGFLILRPYGTFSHPNVLAGYLVIAMTLIIFNFKKPIFMAALIIGTLALFLTLSRVAILLWLIVFGSWLIARGIKKIKLQASTFYVLFSIFSLLLVGFIFANSAFRYRFTNINLSDEAIVQRESLINSSISMTKEHPIFGAGLNNFLVNLPSYQTSRTPLFYLQPVHNIFILVAAETGIIGLAFFLWFIIVTYKRVLNKNQFLIHNSLFIVLSSILILGMFDHYFLTLQQGQILLALVFGLCWSKEYEV